MSEDPRFEAAPGAGERAVRSAAWLFLPVAVVLLLGVRDRLLPRTGSGASAPPATPETLGEAVEVHGWSGSHERASDGARLDARLEPLHPDPARQAFDAAVLSERLGLDVGGQPWRLSLVSRGSPEPLVTDLAAVAIRGLLPLVAGGAPERPDLLPLTALFGAPEGPLPSGERADLVLWGPVPEAPALDVPGLGSVALAPEVRDAWRRSEPVAWQPASSQMSPGPTGTGSIPDAGPVAGPGAEGGR